MAWTALGLIGLLFIAAGIAITYGCGPGLVALGAALFAVAVDGKRSFESPSDTDGRG